MNTHNATGPFQKGQTRRQFLKLAGCGTLGAMTGGLWSARGLLAAGADSPAVFTPDLDIALWAEPGEVAVFPGRPTEVWRYRATVLKGHASRVVETPGSYLGPTLKARRGEKVRIRFHNRLPEETIVHWHGLHVPAIMDGHPRYVVPQGASYLYEFEVKNRAGTYWYHPHPHGRTGPQVYHGLAGLFIVSDAEERAAGLPDGEEDVALVIQDRIFGPDNQLFYRSGNRMAQMTGFLGDRILVNGRPDFTLPVSAGSHRLRLLNGSNSRIYRLAWEDGRPLTVIGTDGGLLERSVLRRYAFLSPGERLEIWADFSDRPTGFETALVSLPFGGGGMGAGRMGPGMMMGGRRGAGPGLPNGAPCTLFRVHVTQQGKNRRPLPETLSAPIPSQRHGTADASEVKQFYLTMQHMQWSINGRVFQMEDVAQDEMVRLGSREIWEFSNTGGGMMRMMDMPHPMHLHGKQFRVLGRSGVTHAGYVDEGWKDTVLLMPGERVRILVDFDDYPGLFLYHCHNLEHGDMGMMRNYFVRR
jgi:FtsP/CotA-like multicopper oxidase with cupredoxin domain